MLVVPRQGFLAAAVQGSSARHPPEGVDVGPGVEVRPPQQAHPSKALLGCRNKTDVGRVQADTRGASLACQCCSDVHVPSGKYM